MDPLFQDIPQDLSGLDDAELAALAASLRERVREVVAGRRDPEVVGELSQSEVTSAVEQTVLGIERIDAEIETRASQDSEYDDTITSLAGRAGVDGELAQQETPPEEETPADGDETPADEEEPEATTAAATERRTLSSLPAARRHKPVESTGAVEGLKVTSYAAGLGSPFEALTVLGRRMLGQFLTEIIGKNRLHEGHKGVLARAGYDFPAERRLSDGPDGYYMNSERIQSIVGQQALVASGGLCAPLPPIYDLPGLETPARPVRGALASFQAVRGGVQVGTTPKMGDYADAVGVVADAENTAGGTSAVKTCLRIECPDFAPVTADSIYTCIEADNLASRAYPELMARIGDLVLAEQARVADSKLLQAIKDGSTQVSYGATDAGSTFYYLGGILKAAAGIRSRNRMTAGTALEALIPSWFIDLTLLDQGRAADQDARAQSRAAIENYLGGFGVRTSFYLDSPSDGDGQIFGAQTAGTLLDFPDTAQIAVFPAGSWLHIDSGALDLGVVRDSTLNATNDFQVFAETWENVAFVGVESLWLTLTVCPSGSFSAGVDLTTTC